MLCVVCCVVGIASLALGSTLLVTCCSRSGTQQSAAGNAGIVYVACFVAESGAVVNHNSRKCAHFSLDDGLS